MKATRLRLALLAICLLRVERATISVAATVSSTVAEENDSRLPRLTPSSQTLEGSFWPALVGDRVGRRGFGQLRGFHNAATLLFATDKCSRYCVRENVRGSGAGNFRYINLFWTTDAIDKTGHFLPINDSRLLTKVEESDTHRPNAPPESCQIYLDLDCNTAEGGTTANYAKEESRSNVENTEGSGNNFGEHSNMSGSDIFSTNVKIAEKYNLSEQTQTKFMVHSNFHRIIMNIDGKVSNALLQIPADATVSRDGTTAISWTRKADANGVRIDATNAPSGEWRVKLVGAEDSKYHFTAEGFVGEGNDAAKRLFLPNPRVKGKHDDGEGNGAAKLHGESEMDDRAQATDAEIILFDGQNSSGPIGAELAESGKLREGNYRAKLEDTSSAGISTGAENVLTNSVEYVQFVGADKAEDAPSSTLEEKPTRGMFAAEEEELLEGRSSIAALEEPDVIRGPMQRADDNISTRMVETLDNRELTEELARYASDEASIEERRMLIEVNRNSNLLVTPGTIHRMIFDVMNRCVLPVRYAFRVKSTPFRLYNVQPPYAWIYPGRMSNVAVDLIVPDNAAPDTANTVTLSILGTEIKEKSAYLYVQGSLSKLTDNAKPTVEYHFNNNCAGKSEKDRCYKSRWSVDITVQDYDSGLKLVVSSPSEIYPRTEFISGTRSPVTFYYSASCCDKTAKITAVDLLDNYNAITIDVTAWNNLSEAEIAAITVGALFALLFVALIVISIAYCVRRRKSHDLTYSQRYGSRPPAQPERTNF